ncbi:MAG: cytochrome-c peroxidase [Oligoflexales bacterium]
MLKKATIAIAFVFMTVCSLYFAQDLFSNSGLGAKALLADRIDYRALRKKASTFLLSAPQLSPYERRLASLGRQIFFDTRLSRNGSVSCATCHQPDKAFTDGLEVARGLALTDRNTPTVLNAFSVYWFFWDGRADSLAAQAVGPIENEKEHGFSKAEVAGIVAKHYREEYEALFGKLDIGMLTKMPKTAHPPTPVIEVSAELLDKALPSVGSSLTIQRLATEAENLGIPIQEAFKREVLGMTAGKDFEERTYENGDSIVEQRVNEVMANVALGIEAYEKGLVANESSFDTFVRSWLNGQADDPFVHFSERFGAEELLGFDIFAGKGACHICHNGGAFSDSQFHNIGLPDIGKPLSLGRSQGLLKAQADEFNCKGVYNKYPERQQRQSCLDLDYLDRDTPEGVGAFKTPMLRNVDQTAPYMHDGRFGTLRDVINHYDAMNTLPAIGFREESLKPLQLDEMEKQALEAFLKSLTSPIRDLTANEH